MATNITIASHRCIRLRCLSVLTRMAAAFDSVGTSAFYTGIAGLVVLTIFLPLEWKEPSWRNGMAYYS